MNNAREGVYFKGDFPPEIWDYIYEREDTDISQVVIDIIYNAYQYAEIYFEYSYPYIWINVCPLDVIRIKEEYSADSLMGDLTRATKNAKIFFNYHKKVKSFNYEGSFVDLDREGLLYYDLFMIDVKKIPV